MYMYVAPWHIPCSYSVKQFRLTSEGGGRGEARETERGVDDLLVTAACRITPGSQLRMEARSAENKVSSD